MSHVAYTEAIVDEALDLLAFYVNEARAVYPGENYAGRVYWCEGCESMGTTCAPADELPDDYPCPECGTARRPLSDVGIPQPPRPNRAARRARRRR